MSGIIKITSQRNAPKSAFASNLHPKIEIVSKNFENEAEKNPELSLLERCKIAVWMDQFKSEEIVQMKFKNHFSLTPPTKELIMQIHQRFLQTGSVLDEKMAPDPCSTTSKNSKGTNGTPRNQEESYQIESEEELAFIKDESESFEEKKYSKLPLDTLVVGEHGEEGSVTMLCSHLEESQEFSEISISEDASRNKLVKMEVIYSCYHCGYKTSNKEAYEQHIETHVMDFFQCTKCNFTSNNTTAFRSHVKLCAKNEIDKNSRVEIKEPSAFLCSECGKAYSSENALKTHKIFHSTSRPFSCSQCKYRFKAETDLKRHMETHENIHNLECPYCNFTCGLKSKMEVHIRAHSGEKPFKCPHCDYCSASKVMLKRHMVSHDKSNIYRCSKCSYTTHRHAFLKNHQLTHSDKKNFKCQLCPLSFKTPNTLSYHMNKVHTKHKLYECPFCDFRQPILHALKAHIRTHTGEKPHSCPHCDYKCSRSQELKKHIQTNHLE